MSEKRIVAGSVGEFLEALASDAPTPGGGAVAALVAAAGAALVGMVARLTVGKKGYEAAEERMRELADRSDAARMEFLDLADRDAHAFDDVMTAFKMPKETDTQRSERSAAIQAGYERAARVPLECLRKGVDAIPLSVEATADGNIQAASDGLSAAASLYCAAVAAAANVQINAEALKDEAARTRLLDEIGSLGSRAERSMREAQAAFEVRMTAHP
jgi:formiminotetrahydrofolate cyclodeaminase